MADRPIEADEQTLLRANSLGKALSGEDELGMVVRAHIHVEHDNFSRHQFEIEYKFFLMVILQSLAAMPRIYSIGTNALVARRAPDVLNPKKCATRFTGTCLCRPGRAVGLMTRH
jgi:hypothetical protein